MPVTTQQIVRGLRAELSLTNPDFRAAGGMIAAALEQLDAGLEEEKRRRGEEDSPGPLPALHVPSPPAVHQPQPAEVRARKRR